VARRQCCTAGVQSGPNPSCVECGTWKSRRLALVVTRQAHRKAGPGETTWRGSKKPTPACNGSDMPTSIWSFFARESVEPFQEEMQMAVDLRSTGASSGCPTVWKSLPWNSFQASVKRLQMRIAKAISIFLMTGWPGPRAAFEGLEPYEGKLSCPVLRGA
jgi:hypothetical protein